MPSKRNRIIDDRHDTMKVTVKKKRPIQANSGLKIHSLDLVHL
jgi:hypothetical protein